MKLSEFITLDREKEIPKKCTDELEICKLDEGSFKEVYRYKETQSLFTKITIFTKQSSSYNFDPIATWSTLKQLDNETKKYLLLPDEYQEQNGFIYAQFTYCQSDLTKSKDLRDQSLFLMENRTRFELGENLKANFMALENVIQKIHDKGLSTLDIKPENMLFKCENKALIVLTDLDGAGQSVTPMFTWFGLEDTQQDYFALYVSILEILKPTFFNKLGTETRGFFSKHYKYADGKPRKWIDYCKKQTFTSQYAKEISTYVIEKLQKLLGVQDIQHVRVSSYFQLKF